MLNNATATNTTIVTIANTRRELTVVQYNTCSRVRRYCTGTPPGEDSGEERSPEGSAENSAEGGGGDGGSSDVSGVDGAAAGKAIADNTAPVGNNADHMVSAVAGNGQVVARAVTARNLLQVRTSTLYPIWSFICLVPLRALHVAYRVRFEGKTSRMRVQQRENVFRAVAALLGFVGYHSEGAFPGVGFASH